MRMAGDPDDRRRHRRPRRRSTHRRGKVLGAGADRLRGRFRGGRRTLRITMADAIRIICALVAAMGVTLLTTPLARRLAVRTAFFDHPVCYKGRSRPTPYLGGVAVMAGLLAGAVIFEGADDYKRLIGAAIAICAVGTLDDRLGLGVTLRLIIQVLTAVAVWAVDLG